MVEIIAQSGLEAQDKLAELVISAKQSDPFKHITLVVESNHQALQFRRQLVRSLARIGAPTSLVSFSAQTKIDLLANIALIAQIDWTYQSYDQARQVALRDVLVARNETFAKLANHAESFETINNYTKQFDWHVLTPEVVENIKSMSGKSATRVALDLLEIALATQQQVRSSEQRSPAEIANLVELNATDQQRQRIAQSLGLVIALVSDYPGTLEDLVEKFVGDKDQHLLRLKVGGRRTEPAQLFSFPDPETEAKAVVREVAKRISQGHPIDQFAVLYSDSNQYADILEHEFEQAQISWNGIATDSPAITRAAQATKGYFAIADSVLARGTFTRADLLLLLRVSSITIDGTELRSGVIEKYISRNSLFNDVKNWLPILKQTNGRLDQLNKELTDLISWKADQEEIDEKQFEIQQAEIAGSVVHLINALTGSVASLGMLDSHQELASQTWQEINTFFPQISKAKMPLERLAHEKLSELFGAAHAATLANLDSVRQSLNVLNQTIFLKLSQLKMQHGELARGVYIGPVSQNGALFFENLWVLGAGDGMLPQAISEDPIFPDSLKETVSSLTSLSLKSVSGRVQEIEANFYAVTSGAKQLTLSFPRGATLIKSEGKPSAWLETVNVNTPIEVQAANEFRLVETGAVSMSDLHSKQSAASATKVSTPSKQLEAALWFAAPTATAYVGNLSEHAAEPLIDFEEKPLSASSVEKFLKCGHNFFTTKLLGIADMEDVDSIDEVRAIDFGKAVHTSFERLLKEFPTLSPNFGEPYSVAAKAKFAELFEQECDLLVARGQAGWAPLFESRKRQFIELIDEYFALEASARSQVVLIGAGPYKRDAFVDMREADLLRPQLAEFAFHKTGDGLLHISVQAGDYPEKDLKFTGLIDRVDVSENREHVGVLDFKTGSKENNDRLAAIQDLLYEYAIRHSTQFLGVKKVSSRYLYLAKKLENSGLLDIRSDRDKRVFLPEENEGLSGAEYSDALVKNQQKSEAELLDRLALLVSASMEGKFLTHNVDIAAASFRNCVTCKKLGVRQVARLAKVLYPPVQNLAEDTEEEQI